MTDTAWKKFWKRLRLVPAVKVDNEQIELTGVWGARKESEHKCNLKYVRTADDDWLEFQCSKCGLVWAWARWHIQLKFDLGVEQKRIKDNPIQVVKGGIKWGDRRLNDC